jgi:PKD repeat protein
MSRFGAHHFGHAPSFGPSFGFGGFHGHGHGHGGGFGHPHGFPHFPKCPEPPPPEPTNEDPTAALTTPDSETDFWVGETVSFDASASFDSDGSIVSYEWDFGDGTTTTTTDPTTQHAYDDDTAGGYSASVTVTDDGGAMDTAELGFTLTEPGPLDAEFTTTPQTLEGDAPFSIEATSTSDSGGPEIVSSLWISGDGAFIVGDALAYTYTAPGFYLLELQVTDELGRVDSETSLVTIEAPNEDPTAALTTPDGETDFWVGESVSFDATASFDSDGTIVSYEWDFGDGNTQVSTGPTVDHTYTDAAGAHTASVTVTDDGGAMDTAEFDFTLADPGPLVASFITDDEDLTGAAPYSLDATNTSTSGGPEIVSIEWEASHDQAGNTGSGETFQTVFNSPGNFTITLTVEDEIGRMASESANVTVTLF